MLPLQLHQCSKSMLGCHNRPAAGSATRQQRCTLPPRLRSLPGLPVRPAVHHHKRDRQAVTTQALPGVLDGLICSLSSLCPTWVNQMVSAATCGALAAAAAALFAVYKLVKLATADADLNLLSKGPLPAQTFQGKVVWIIGASQGVGRLIALDVAKRGAKIILSARSQERLQAVKAELASITKDVVVLPVDLCGPFTQLEQVAKTADQAFDGQGVDFLVHAAGASMSALAAEVTSEVTDALFGVNTLGPIKMTRAALPLMLARGKGRIAVVASMAAKVPSPGQAVYSACKMGVYGYFSSLASEVADSGVSVTIVCPGPVEAAADAAPRAVYSATGLTTQPPPAKADKARLATERCVELISAAIGHGVDEAWIAKHPVLALGYVFQFLPWLGWKAIKKVGPSRARALKEGRSGYDVKSIAKSST